MVSKIKSFSLNGLEGEEIEIGADRAGGLHAFNIVGLPDTAIKESKERVGSAIKNIGFKPPYYFGRITVCLAPSYLKKTGSGLDFPIAISILEATNQIYPINEEAVYIGELSLDGKLRYTPGVLPVVISAKQAGYKKIFIPKENYQESCLVKGIEIIPLGSISDYLDFQKGMLSVSNFDKSSFLNDKKLSNNYIDLSSIKGQEKAKRSLIIAAAGGHNLLFSGPPGTGKTLMAKALPFILPDLSQKEQLEVTKIYSVAGLLSREGSLITKRPFRSPHHSASSVALVGGGSKIMPGEITLAHRGVLFMDEILEFSQKSLDNLRQPLEDKEIWISRASGSVKFPANFILVGATNPCPCGYLNDSYRKCTCSPSQILKYRKKISGPILDRIDLITEVGKIKYSKLTKKSSGITTKKAREQIQKARAIQRLRYEKLGFFTNSEAKNKEVGKYCQLDLRTQRFMEKAMSIYGFSTRTYYKVIKIGRTIADLESSRLIKQEHLAEALQYQVKEFNF